MKPDAAPVRQKHADLLAVSADHAAVAMDAVPSTDCGDLRICLEMTDQLGMPIRRRDGIVVQEDTDLARSRVQSGVAGGDKSRAVHEDLAKSNAVCSGDDVPTRRVLRANRNQNLVESPSLSCHACQGLTKDFGPTPGGNDKCAGFNPCGVRIARSTRTAMHRRNVAR